MYGRGRAFLFLVIHRSISVAYHCSPVTKSVQEAFRRTSRFDRKLRSFCQRAGGGLPGKRFGT